MSIKFTELPVLAAIDVADDDILAIVDVSVGTSKQVTVGSLGGDPSIGWGQTWQDVTGSRAVATSYQNTTSRPIMVSIEASTSVEGPFEVSVDNSTWVRIGFIDVVFGAPINGAWIIPPLHYYRQSAGSFSRWVELR